MDNSVQLWEKPAAEEIYLVAGWRQWADAGSVSSGLPQHLITQTGARKIGELDVGSCYLFQIPGTHHLLRPEVKFEEGYRTGLQVKKNEFYYAGDERKGLVIFLGDEPHLNADGYADAFLQAVEALGVKRVVAMGGVYGAMPYDKEREVSCVYSLPRLKEELADYAVRFSNYEGGSTISTYLLDDAEQREIELIDFYAFVPAYDFSQLSARVQGIRIENDYKAWYDLVRRLNHMFGMTLELAELQQQSEELLATMDAKITELEEKVPQLKIREFMATLASEFTETPFMPLSDVWERELGDLFEDLDD